MAGAMVQGPRPCARQSLRAAPAAASAAHWRSAAAAAAAFRPAGRPLVKRQRLGEAARQQRQRQVGGRLAVRAAMFDGLSRSLEKAWDSVRRDGKLTADNIKEPLREIR